MQRAGGAHSASHPGGDRSRGGQWWHPARPAATRLRPGGAPRPAPGSPAGRPPALGDGGTGPGPRPGEPLRAGRRHRHRHPRAMPLVRPPDQLRQIGWRLRAADRVVRRGPQPSCQVVHRWCAPFMRPGSGSPGPAVASRSRARPREIWPVTVSALRLGMSAICVSFRSSAYRKPAPPAVAAAAQPGPWHRWPQPLLSTPDAGRRRVPRRGARSRSAGRPPRPGPAPQMPQSDRTLPSAGRTPRLRHPAEQPAQPPARE